MLQTIALPALFTKLLQDVNHYWHDKEIQFTILKNTAFQNNIQWISEQLNVYSIQLWTIFSGKVKQLEGKAKYEVK